jgi:molybdopterin converting factor small subunit
VTVKLFAMFRNGRFKVAEFDYPDGTTCRQIVARIGLSEEELGVVMVNGRHAWIDRIMAEGDCLSLFPLVGGG